MVAEEILRGDTIDVDLIHENIYERIYNGDGSVSDLSSMNITNIVDFELLWSNLPGHLNRWKIHHLRKKHDNKKT